jgi:hypothetical protein
MQEVIQTSEMMLLLLAFGLDAILELWKSILARWNDRLGRLNS